MGPPARGRRAQRRFPDDASRQRGPGRGGLESFASVLKSPFLYVPHDAIVPGALTAGDLPEIVEALAPRAWRHDGAVDGLNRRVGAGPPDESPARWLLSRLAR